MENELRPQCPTYDFHAGISLKLVLFTYSCCVAVLDSKVVSIGWETGLGGESRTRPGTSLQGQGQATGKLNVSILCVKFISKIPLNEFAFLDR